MTAVIIGEYVLLMAVLAGLVVEILVMLAARLMRKYNLRCRLSEDESAEPRRSKREIVTLGCCSLLVLLALPSALRERAHLNCMDMLFIFFMWATLYGLIMRTSLARELNRYSRSLGQD
jgi:hypothetical protein